MSSIHTLSLHRPTSKFSSITNFPWLSPTDNWTKLKVKVKVKITLRLAVYSQSVCLSVKPIETDDQRFFLQLNPCCNSLYVTSALTRRWVSITLWQLRSCLCEAPSLTRGRVCRLYSMLLFTAPCNLKSSVRLRNYSCFQRALNNQQQQSFHPGMKPGLSSRESTDWGRLRTNTAIIWTYTQKVRGKTREMNREELYKLSSSSYIRGAIRGGQVECNT
jgi:hypothetical protein